MSTIDAAELAAIIRSNSFLQIERPPELWGLQTTGLEPFIRALGESIAAGLFRNGNQVSALTLNVANVVDENGAEFVAVTIKGAGSWTEVSWTPGSDVVLGGKYLTRAAAAARVARGYVRDLGDGTGSVTVLYHRAG